MVVIQYNIWVFPHSIIFIYSQCHKTARSALLQTQSLKPIYFFHCWCQPENQPPRPLHTVRPHHFFLVSHTAPRGEQMIPCNSQHAAPLLKRTLAEVKAFTAEDSRELWGEIAPDDINVGKANSEEKKINVGLTLLWGWRGVSVCLCVCACLWVLLQSSFVHACMMKCAFQMTEESSTLRQVDAGWQRRSKWGSCTVRPHYNN